MKGPVSELTAAMVAHGLSVALCAARVAPIAYLCPVFGGALAPMTVRIAVTFAFASALHLGGGVAVEPACRGLLLLAAVVQEVCFGAVIGLVAGLPFEAAKLGGRWIDALRGSNAEVMLPMVGSGESATSGGLHQALIAIVAAGGGLPALVRILWRSFRVVRPGLFSSTGSALAQVTGALDVAMRVGLAIALPVVAGCALIDLGAGLLSKAGPRLGLESWAPPLRIIGGGALLWAIAQPAGDRLLSAVFSSLASLGEWLEGLAR